MGKLIQSASETLHAFSSERKEANGSPVQLTSQLSPFNFRQNAGTPPGNQTVPEKNGGQMAVQSHLRPEKRFFQN